MLRRGLGFLLLLGTVPVLARLTVSSCGTSRDGAREVEFFHRQALRARARTQAPGVRPLALTAAGANRDIGNIAIIEDADGVVARQNEFNLDFKTLRFTPNGANAPRYRYSVVEQGYETAAANGGTPLAALDDDDTRQISLPFPFPFFGATYTQVFVNSDGNLTFTRADKDSSDRSLGRMVGGPPRISPLFDDLDPALTAGGVRVLADSSRVVVSWVSVPEWMSSGIGARQSFQLKLYPDGAIEFSYAGINATNAIVGIAPGNSKGQTALLDFRNDPSAEYSGAVAERFGNRLQIDAVTLAQRFYQTHEDAYDYLVIYNNMDVPVLSDGVVALEFTVRNNATGFGGETVDTGEMYGSKSRLQAVLNMGPLGGYPTDPNTPVGPRRQQLDTPLTVLGHETGHRFLAFASVTDPEDPSVLPMLGYQNSHWSFAFNSEASLLEGERIVDRGSSASPRFLTSDITQEYSPVDQYLMGFRAPADVPDTFVVTGVPSYMTQWHQISGYAFDGQRRNISAQNLIDAVGRRTPDSTVAQRRYRFAFILVVPQGTEVPAAQLAKLETFRREFEPFFAKASSGNAAADASLKRSLAFSLFPASGVVAGAGTTATLTVASPSASEMTVDLQARKGNLRVPASVKLPAGTTSVSFTISGVRAGVEEVTAVPGDPAYDSAFARVQVADAALLQLIPVSGTQQISRNSDPLPDPVVVRLTDANRLPYPGVPIRATPSGDGRVGVTAVVTDSRGEASFIWTPGSGPSNELKLSVEAAPAVALTLSAGSAVPVVSAVVNGASFAAGIPAGGFGTVAGYRLSSGRTASAGAEWPTTMAGVQVLLNGSALPLTYVSDTQINFYTPSDARTGVATLTVVTPEGVRAASAVTVVSLQPGIFTGAVLHAGTSVSAVTSPVRAGDYIEIYCTGLGPTRNVSGLQRTVVTPTVFVGAIPVQPIYSGLTPGVPGLYQVNIQIPEGLAPGKQPLSIGANLAHSNEVFIGVQ